MLPLLALSASHFLISGLTNPMRHAKLDKHS